MTTRSTATTDEQRAARAAHRMTWFVWAGGERLRHTSTMRGTWGWDAECTCGWATRTGGAVKSYVDNLVWEHKFFAERGIA